MAELISFYSPIASQGKRTFSLSLANLLAKNHHRVLYIELDPTRSALALTNGISHPYKNALNYFKAAHEQENFRIERFVLTNEDLLNLSRSDFKSYPSNLDFLTFPSDFTEEEFPVVISSDTKNPEEIATDFIKKFIFEIAATNYDYIILSLPNEINHMFAYEVMTHSNKIVNLATPSPVNLSQNRKIMELVKKGLKEDVSIHTIVNMASANVDYSLYKTLTGVNENLIISQFDEERQENEYAMKIESNLINENVIKLADNMKILLQEMILSKPKKTFFSR